MKIPNTKALAHKNQLYRTLRAIYKDNVLANTLYFKGGTYAALSGRLDRFSVDLDFDILPLEKAEKDELRDKLKFIFTNLQLETKDESKNHLQFFLKYPALSNERNTLKVEINDQVSLFNTYEKTYLREVDLYCQGHDAPTMFANKLVAAKARYDEGKRIAGRDFYDLHYFFSRGYGINKDVVADLTGMNFEDYISELVDFTINHVTTELLRRDLNPLMPADKLNFIVDKLQEELLFFLRSIDL